jgi:hypothetical protein
MIANETPNKGGILAALRRSPLVEADLDLTRSNEMESILKSRRVWWTVITVAAVCAVIAGGALFIDSFMSDFGACTTAVRNSIPSPDGKKSLVIFGKECGATVGFNTQASIAPTGFAFSTEKSPAFFAISGEHVVVAKWLGDSTVEISSIPEKERVFKSEQRVGDIKVVYK